MELTDPARVQAVLQVLSDEYSRKILLSAISASKSVEELSRLNDIPLSTCYRRVHELLADGLLVMDRIVVTPDGKRYEMLRSSYKGFSVAFEDGSVKVEVVVNTDMADKLHTLWISMKK
ncbi:MAG TPA: helix-turn-helix domain-containing protein [Nitrososphaerales archaeon]|nr:helix-turn-helix domain-containing protein [Nitrososphaerales archaeon]